MQTALHYLSQHIGQTTSVTDVTAKKTKLLGNTRAQHARARGEGAIEQLVFLF